MSNNKSNNFKNYQYSFQIVTFDAVEIIVIVTYFILYYWILYCKIYLILNWEVFGCESK